MGNVCTCQQFTYENMELISGRSENVNKSRESITISHYQGTTLSKKTIHKQNDDDGDDDKQVLKVLQIELKRGDKNKQGKLSTLSYTVE